jgi:hypothetical protein
MTAILRESYLLKTDRLTNNARKPISRKFFKDYSFYLNNWQQGNNVLCKFLNLLTPEFYI